MMKIDKKSLSSAARVWCDIQNYLASKNQLDAHNLDFKCQRLEPRQLLSATPVGSEAPDETNINETQIEAPLTRLPSGDFIVDSFFDVSYDLTIDGKGNDFNVDSFFDIYYRLTPPGSDFNIDSFFDVFTELAKNNDDGGVLIVDSFFDVFFELAGKPGNTQPVDSFFDIFYDVPTLKRIDKGGIQEDQVATSTGVFEALSGDNGEMGNLKDVNGVRKDLEKSTKAHKDERTNWLDWDESETDALSYADFSGRIRNIRIRHQPSETAGKTESEDRRDSSDWIHIQFHGTDFSSNKNRLSVLIKSGNKLKHGVFEKTDQGWAPDRPTRTESSTLLFGNNHAESDEELSTVEYFDQVTQQLKRDFGPVLPFGWEVERASPLNVNEKKLIINNGGKAEDPKNKMSLKGKVAPPPGAPGDAGVSPFVFELTLGNPFERGGESLNDLTGRGSEYLFSESTDLLYELIARINQDGVNINDGRIDLFVDVDTGDVDLGMTFGLDSFSLKGNRSDALEVWRESGLWDTGETPDFSDDEINLLVSDMLNDFLKALKENGEDPYQEIGYAVELDKSSSQVEQNLAYNWNSFDGRRFDFQGEGVFLISEIETTQSGEDEAEDSIVLDYGAINISYQQRNNGNDSHDVDFQGESIIGWALVDDGDVSASAQYDTLAIDWDFNGAAGSFGPTDLIDAATSSGTDTYFYEVEETNSRLNRRANGDDFTTTQQFDDIKGNFDVTDASGGGAGAGKVKFERLTMKKYSDRATVGLFRELVDSPIYDHGQLANTYLTQLPSGDFVVDSFFDIDYGDRLIVQDDGNTTTTVSTSHQRGRVLHHLVFNDRDDGGRISNTSSSNVEPSQEEFTLNYELMATSYSKSDKQGNNSGMTGDTKNYRFRGPKTKVARRFREPIFGPSKALDNKGGDDDSNIVFVNIYDGDMFKAVQDGSGYGDYKWRYREVMGFEDNGEIISTVQRERDVFKMTEYASETPMPQFMELNLKLVDVTTIRYEQDAESYMFSWDNKTMGASTWGNGDQAPFLDHRLSFNTSGPGGLDDQFYEIIDVLSSI